LSDSHPGVCPIAPAASASGCRSSPACGKGNLIKERKIKERKIKERKIKERKLWVQEYISEMEGGKS